MFTPSEIQSETAIGDCVGNRVFTPSEIGVGDRSSRRVLFSDIIKKI
jgi:hypothetical protein